MEEWPADKVERRSLDTFIPYARNSRTHSDEQVSQIAASINEWGFTTPVLVDESNVLIAGHGRVLAAQKLGLKEIPCMVAEGWTDAQKQAYVIADNKLALNAGWDDDLLKIELSELGDLDFDLDLIGFNSSELADLLKSDDVEGLTDEDAVPDAPIKPVTVEGDVWILGKHRLMCGDSTSIDSVDKLMDGQKADMVFTDPPWNVNYGASSTPKYKQGRTILNDSMSDEKWFEFCNDIAASLFFSTKSGSAMYCVMSAQEWPVVDKSLREAGFHWSSSIIWSKDSFVISRKDYHTQYEPIWYGWNKKGPRLMEVPDRKQSDVWQCVRPKISEYHPTTKPIELIERAILNSSWRGALIIDLFGGSGSTMIACEKNGREAALMELDPKYCDVIIKRWEDFTGSKATLETTGQTYQELEGERLAS